MWVPPCGDHETGKFANQIYNPSSHPSPAPMEQIPEWLTKPMMKAHSSIPQEDVTVHNSNLKADLDLCYPLSSSHPDSFYHDSPDQSASPTNFSHSLYSQAVGSNCD